MFNTFIITLREGVEVAVILAVILAYLRQLGQSQAAGRVWLGTGAAVLVSILAAAGIFYLLGTSELEEFQEILEGTFMILAVVILTMMTFWMKRQSSDISGELKRQVQEALSSGSVWALASLAFASVIREGIETVLFIVGSAQESSLAGVLGGSVLGFGTAAIIGYMLYQGTHRLPLKSFFTVMSVLLMFMAAGLLASGVHAFQEVHLIPEGMKVWNIKYILSEKSTMGSLLKAVFGYRDNPDIILVTTYWSYLIPALYAYFKPNKLSGDDKRDVAHHNQ